MLLVLSGLSFLGLSQTFAGHRYLVVAMVGVIVGGLIAYGAHLLRQPVIVLIAVGVLTFFVLGGALTVRDDPGGSSLPTGSTLHLLAHEAVSGWKDLLTTLPPVDGAGPLLVLPYLMGLFVGLCGVALATRTRSAAGPAIAPFLALIAVILIGTENVKLLSLRSVTFLVLSLVWVSVRASRNRPVVQSGSGRVMRLGLAVGALVVAALAAVGLGPNLPGSSSHARLLLRNYVSPPFNVGNYPSTLAEYQKYVQCDPNLQIRGPGNALFTVGGSFPPATAITFATLDVYDGTVWAATNSTNEHTASPDTFLKVGPTLDNPIHGSTSTLTVSIGSGANAYSDYWMPSAGALQAITFRGPNAGQDTADFRYNLATNTGIVPGGLGAGDSYTLRVADAVPTMLQSMDGLSTSASLPQPPNVQMDFVGKAVTALGGPAGSSSDTAGRILDLGTALRYKGKLTDCRSDYGYYLSGHSAGRLNGYVNGLSGGGPSDPSFLGDNEQAAALYALMIEDLGVPARVVVGVQGGLQPGATVLSSQVSAWVEVLGSNGRSWYTIPASTFSPTARPVNPPQPQPQPLSANHPVPPPAQGRAKTQFDDSTLASGTSTTAHKASHSGGSGLPAWVATIVRWTLPPMLVIALICTSIVGAKAVRRRRRRSRGTPSQQFALGWREILDQARDLGAAVTAGRTRREHARDLAQLDLTALAHHADARVFGPQPPTAQDATNFWSEVDATRRKLKDGLGRLARWRAALNVTSFRRLDPRTDDA